RQVFSLDLVLVPGASDRQSQDDRLSSGPAHCTAGQVGICPIAPGGFLCPLVEAGTKARRVLFQHLSEPGRFGRDVVVMPARLLQPSASEGGDREPPACCPFVYRLLAVGAHPWAQDAAPAQLPCRCVEGGGDVRELRYCERLWLDGMLLPEKATHG